MVHQGKRGYQDLRVLAATPVSLDQLVPEDLLVLMDNQEALEIQVSRVSRVVKGPQEQ